MNLKRTAWAATAAVTVLAASNVAVAQQQTRSDTASKANVVTASPDYSKSMRQLQAAAQRLRESIQALAQQQPGPRRDQAIAAAHQALYDTQQAMIQLPPELRNAPAPVGSTGIAPAYRESMDKLQSAADRLREAVQAMAGQEAGPRRNAAMQEAREALYDTQQAMVHLPVMVASAQDTTGAKAGKGQTQARETGGSQGPLVVLFPPAIVATETFASGCWARLYERNNFQGDFLTITGPGDFAYMRTAFGNVARNWDSVTVGPKATLQAYDNENFTQRVATFKSGQRVPDLDEKLGFFENIRSAKITCTK